MLTPPPHKLSGTKRALEEFSVRTKSKHHLSFIQSLRS
jgi:hypothetical protein